MRVTKLDKEDLYKHLLEAVDDWEYGVNTSRLDYRRETLKGLLKDIVNYIND